MTRKTTTSTLQRVRRVLLFGLFVFVGGLLGLWLFGRQPRVEPPPAEADQTAGLKATIIGRQFRYEVTEDGEKLFDIEAERLLSDESALYILEGVKVSMQRANGSEYAMTAERGTYRLEVNEATLEGNVVLTGSGGLRLETEGLELSRRGNLVVSSAPVVIEVGETYRGSANRLEVLFPRNQIMLAGKVLLETAPGISPRASLAARRTIFFRDTHNFLAEGRVVLEREADSLKARRLSLNFDDAERKILFARANWQVEAKLHQLDEEGEVTSISEVFGDQLSVVFDEVTGDPQRLEIGSPDDRNASLRSIDEPGLVRTMTADYLWGEFEQGRLQQAQGLGGVTIEEIASARPKRPLRQIVSEAVEASYDSTGKLDTLTLDGEVNYVESDLRASGDRLTAEGEDGTISLVGDLASIENEDGTLEAPEILFDRAAGKGYAVGGVRAEISKKAGPDLAVGQQAEEPVRIEAARAEWTREPQEFKFEENVRAWQGENFLVSQTLAMADEELTADGGVRSAWQGRSGEEATAGENDGTEEAPVTISAAKMRYLEGQGRLVYEGNASVVQAARSMSCPLLQLETNDEEEFERMYCEGGTRIIDGDGGSQISGDAAIYNTTAGKVKILGDPVRLNQTTGGTISARLMVYDFETAIAEIDSVKDEDADLFMTTSEYFKQFGYPTPPPVALPVEPELVPAEGDEAIATEGEAPATDAQGASAVAEDAVPATEAAAEEPPTTPSEPSAEEPPVTPSEPAADDDGDAR